MNPIKKLVVIPIINYNAKVAILKKKLKININNQVKMICQTIPQLALHKNKIGESLFILHVVQSHHHVEFDQLKPLKQMLVQDSTCFKFLPQVCNQLIIVGRCHCALTLILKV